MRDAPSPVTAASCTGALSWPTTTAPSFTGCTAGRGRAGRGRTTSWPPPPREPTIAATTASAPSAPISAALMRRRRTWRRLAGSAISVLG